MGKPEEGRGTRAALLVGAFVLIALTFAIGRVTAPGETSDPAPALAVPANPAAELDARYEHSPNGAGLAAGAYQRVFADAGILRPGMLKTRIDAVATPTYADKMLEANRPGTDRVIAGPVGRGMRQGVPTIYLGVPIAYRVLSYTPERAQIQNWGFTIVGNASTVEPAAYFGTNTSELLWRDGRWKIDSSRSAFGPTPRTLTPREGAEGFELEDLATGYRPYGLAP